MRLVKRLINREAAGAGLSWRAITVENGGSGYCRALCLPAPMTDRPGLDFSFSGLKTFAANTIRDNGTDDQTRADIARAFEDAVVDTLMIKCKRALDQTGFKRLVMAGGVSANRTLRAKLAEMMKKRRGEVF